MTHPSKKTAAIILADGTVFWGRGFGACVQTQGEICFNTSMTGYQESLTDPSYAGQIITFTFPHIGNVGANMEDLESEAPAARGLITRQMPTPPSNWRSSQSLDEWLKTRDIPGIAGIDTRALTQRIRDAGAPDAVLVHKSRGEIDIESLKKQAARLPGLDGQDLAKQVTCLQSYSWNQGLWNPDKGYNNNEQKKGPKVIAIDFGAKRNILRHLASRNCDLTVVPASTCAEDILNMKPDGIFLSNGPGDPSATGEYAVPCVQKLLQSGKPLFGICLGHQILCLALGARTQKMHLGHRGANHPVKDHTTGKVEITSQNHGFEVLSDSLPESVEQTHTSLFDGSNEGIKLKDRPVFSVQYHPEASPGPQDSAYLFDQFMEFIE